MLLMVLEKIQRKKICVLYPNDKISYLAEVQTCLWFHDRTHFCKGCLCFLI